MAPLRVRCTRRPSCRLFPLINAVLHNVIIIFHSILLVKRWIDNSRDDRDGFLDAADKLAATVFWTIAEWRVTSLRQEICWSSFSGPEIQSTDGADPSTSGGSPTVSNAGRRMDNSSSSEERDTFNYEATLDHASKLALIRKRKRREAAAARLDNTLSRFVEWVKENTSRKEEKMAARDEERKRFYDEVINSMRLASTSLARLTDYIIASNCRCAGNSGACTNTVDNASVPSGTVKVITGGVTQTSPVASTSSAVVSCNECIFEPCNPSDADIETDCKLENLGSDSLLGDSSGDRIEEQLTMRPQSTPKHGKTIKKAPKFSKGWRKTSDNSIAANSPYLIVKDEKGHTTPVKRVRKKKLFSP